MNRYSFYLRKGDFEMVSNANVAICTALMVGAIVWVLIGEHNASDYGEADKDDKIEKKD